MHYLSFFIDLMLFFEKNGGEDGKTAARRETEAAA